ncbi:hypothetical protein FOPE_03490 [Fonsecaea pedrosoi]|nr:hypothetical protein FOPE_03490 [Fonsecaea pedrosoi]
MSELQKRVATSSKRLRLPITLVIWPRKSYKTDEQTRCLVFELGTSALKKETSRLVNLPRKEVSQSPVRAVVMVRSNHSRPIPTQIWEKHKFTIYALYARLPLDQVMAEMQQKHDFAATAQQYKRQLGKWGLRKNVLTELDVIDDESIARGGKDSQRQIRRFQKRKQLKTQKPANPKPATPRTTRSSSAQKRRPL